MLEGNEYGKVEGTSLIEFLWVEVATYVGPCDGMSDVRDIFKLELPDGRYDRVTEDMEWS